MAGVGGWMGFSGVYPAKVEDFLELDSANAEALWSITAKRALVAIDAVRYLRS
jgi:hypothetical protein